MTAESPRRGWGGVITLVAIGVVVAAWGLAASPLFHVRDVRVQGNRHLSTAEIVRLAGIRGDANLLTVRPNLVLRALVRSPWIRTAEVRRDLPSTLVVTVEERLPVAWVRQGEGIAVLAGDGTVLARRPKPPRGIVDLGAWGSPLRSGGRLDDLQEPLAVAGSLPRRLLRQVEGASMRGGEVILRLRDGARVRYGEARSLEAKNMALANILRWAGQRGEQLASLDLRAPRNPAVSVRGG